MDLNITCIIPTYNMEKYIVQTVESVLNQSLRFSEIIIVDDGSYDKTVEIVKEIQKKSKLIKLIELDVNKGVSYARNLGVKLASSEYIVFLDGDDLLNENFLNKYIETLSKVKLDEEYIAIYSQYIQIDNNGNQIGDKVVSKTLNKRDAFKELLVRNTISTSGLLMKKTRFMEVKGFNEGLRLSEDWELWLRLSKYGGFFNTGEALVEVRRHKRNSSKDIEKMLEAEKDIIKSYDMNYIKEKIFKYGDLESNFSNYIKILFKIDEYDNAYNEILKFENNYNISLDELFFYKGIYFFKNKEYLLSIQEFKNINNPDVSILNNIGCCYLLLGEKELARKNIEKAAKLNPNYIDANKNLDLINNNIINLEEVNLTERILRKSLTVY